MPATPLVDRTDEIELLKTFLADDTVRLTVLTGACGVGKTRLAMDAAAAVGHRFKDGVWMIPLAGVRDPQLVPATILDTLKLPAGGRPAADALKTYLRPRQHLLLLDNFEQTMGAAPFLAELVESAPKVKVLVTSRIPLHLRAEHEVPIAPLQVPPERATTAQVVKSPAVQLFLDRARAARPTFDLEAQEIVAVAEIVRRFDGLPLAIELAASRCRLLAPSELLQRLTATLDVGGALRDLPDRQRTLRAAIQWSFDLLGEREQSVFLRLSVFRSGFTVEGAHAVCPGIGAFDLLDSLEALVDSSLVSRQPAETQSRYVMLEIVGEFAEEKLLQAGHAPESRAHHAAYVADLVRTAAAEIFGPGQKIAVRALDREYANVAAAMDWYLESGEVERLAEITWNFWPYWWFFGRFGEGGRRARIALETLPCSGLAGGRLSAVVGIAALWAGDPTTAVTFLERSLARFREVADTDGAATVLVIMALALWAHDPQRAAALIDECRPLFSSDTNAWGLAVCANVLAWLMPPTDAAGNPTPYARESLDLAESSGDDLNLGMALTNIADQELELGRLEAARAHLERGVRLLSGMADRYAITTCFESIGRIAALTGDPATGVELFGAAEGLREWLQAPIHPGQAERHARLSAELRSKVDQSDYDRLLEQGKLLDYDAAVALATSACAKSAGADAREPELVSAGTNKEAKT